jgi:hypothetical protein
LIALGAAVVIAAVALTNRDQAPTDDQVATAPAAVAAAPVPVSVLRTVTSTSCASNGCPTACDSGETFMSALCVGTGSASFAKNLQVDGGVITASCGPNAGSIVVACARN